MNKPQFAFFEGKIVPISEAKVDIRTHSLQYGTAVFEGIKGYWNPEEKVCYLFRMREHYQRMLRNCKILMIDLKMGLDELERVTIELCKKENYTEDFYVRPYAYKKSLEIGPKLVGLEDGFFIYTVPMGKYIETERGIRVKVSSWQKVPDNALPARGKIVGSYVHSALQKTEAILDGYDEAIVLCADGHVSEGSAMNLFIVRDGKLITPPVTSDILEGITRATVIEMAKSELGLEVIERQVDRTELYVADEMFFTGTAAQVSPIVEIDHRKVGDGQIGPITRKIMNLYFDVVRGKIRKYSGWLTRVE